MKPEIAEEYVGFLTHEKKLSERTVAEYCRELSKYIEWCGTTNVVPLEASMNELRKYTRHLSESKLKESSISRAISSLKTFYKWAKMDGHAQHDPAYYLITPKRPKRLPVYLTGEETQILVDSFSAGGVLNLQKQVIVLLYMYCGLRARELTGLLIRNIERDGNGTPIRLRVIGKGNKERILPITKPIQIPLKKWLDHRKNLNEWNYSKDYKRPIEYIKSPYLIPGLEGGELDYSSVQHAVKSACEKAGVTVVTPHKLRHTFATNLSRSGVQLPVIQSLLGHECIMTTQIYTHVTQNEAEKAVHDVYGN